jgi:hypothetical protein
MMGRCHAMTHYNAFLAYDNQSGSRGDEQLNSINWLMLMATKRSGENELMFRGMFSLDPGHDGKGLSAALSVWRSITAGRSSIASIHDLFMELAGRYRLVNPKPPSLYVAPAGEPALGPPAFAHRMSAMNNPASPLGHHWLDSTHIARSADRGVAQNGQLEGSSFNGREPDGSLGHRTPETRLLFRSFHLESVARGRAGIARLSEKSGRAASARAPWRMTASLMHVAKCAAKCDGDDARVGLKRRRCRDRCIPPRVKRSHGS